MVIRAGRVKSSATSPVMSATVKRSPAMNGRLASAASTFAMFSSARARLISAHSATCCVSNTLAAGWL